MPDLFFKTEKFEGPIELLLDLVEKRKLHVSDVSLSQVADDFILHVQKLGELPLSVTTNFVFVASVLLLIKSKSLLPGLQLTEIESGEINDLEKRLAMFEILNTQAGVLLASYGQRIIYHSCRRPIQHALKFAPGTKLDISGLVNACQELIARTPAEEKLSEKTVAKIISLDEMIINLHERVNSALRLSFKQAGSSRQKVEIIVTFLAMLELVKRGVMQAKQDAIYSDIMMETDTIAMPKYG